MNNGLSVHPAVQFMGGGGAGQLPALSSKEVESRGSQALGVAPYCSGGKQVTRHREPTLT